MINWKIFVAGEKRELKSDDSYSELIIKALGADLHGFFAKTDGEKTKHIMDALSLLGDNGLDQHFKVLSNKFTPGLKPKTGEFLRKEWLYDLHWFTDSGGYKLTRLPLAVECEWRWIRKDGQAQEAQIHHEAIRSATALISRCLSRSTTHPLANLAV